MKDGFADQTGFWTTLWNAIMIDVPTRPGPHQLPGHRRAGRDGCHRFRADPAVRPGDSRCPASRRSAPIRVGSRPHRQHGLTSDSAPQRSPGRQTGAGVGDGNPHGVRHLLTPVGVANRSTEGGPDART
jgi:hypothetical protein